MTPSAPVGGQVSLPRGAQWSPQEQVRATSMIRYAKRKDLSAFDEAHAVHELVGLFGNQSEVARQLGYTPAWVCQRLALLRLLPELREAFLRGEIGIQEARRLGSLSEEEQRAAHARLGYRHRPSPVATFQIAAGPEGIRDLADQLKHQIGRAHV